MPDCDIYVGSDELTGSQGSWAVKDIVGMQNLLYIFFYCASVLSAEVAQVISHAPDNLMKSPC
jgi:hypothetical protein